MDLGSQRAQQLAANRLMPRYLFEEFERRRRRSHPEAGYVSLCVAENKLVSDILLERIAECPPPPARVLGYDDMIGSPHFRRQVAEFAGRSFLGRDVDPANVLIVNGAGSVLDLLAFALGDPGDGVLVPTPSYAGFWMDLEGRAELRIVPVNCSSDDGFQLTTAHLDEALATADRPIKALLFTTPNNPLGRVYTPAQVDEILEWCETNQVHAIFDEIYALSVFGDTPFTSVATRRPALGDYVHIVWAFSKDFGMSGLRAGVLITENETVHAAVDGLAYWSAVSGHTQFLLGDMISDEAWVDGYVKQMQGRLGAAYANATGVLDEAGIGYVPGEAGFFFIADMRPLMDDVSWDGEHRLWERMIEEANVNITPGSACRNDEPGFMRICFAAEPLETVAEGLRRIATL